MIERMVRTRKMDRKVRAAPGDGIALRRYQPSAVVNRMEMNKNLAKYFAEARIGPSLPEDTRFKRHKFHWSDSQGSRVFGNTCLGVLGIRRLVLSSSVKSVDGHAFHGCDNLGYADLAPCTV